MSTKATARPWHIAEYGDNLRITIVHGPKGIANIVDDISYGDEPGRTPKRQEAEANAALIVRAVNHLDALEAVAEAARNYLQSVYIPDGGFVSEQWQMSEKQLRAALAKLEEVGK